MPCESFWGGETKVSVKRRTFVFVVLALLVWALVASLIGATYYYAYTDLYQKTRKPIIYVSLGFNYGNGTVKWFNQTSARAGDTLLDVTGLKFSLNYTIWPSSGAFLDSLDNVKNSPPYYWMWWMWTSFGWVQGQAAMDRFIVGDGETYYWYYEDTSLFPMPTPP